MPNTERLEELDQLSSGMGHVLGWLGRSADVEARPVGEILRGITETAAHTLHVTRVNVWLFDERRSALRCVEGFDARSGRHEPGETLLASEHPSYFRCLELLRHVSALDVHGDPRTAELDSYLRKHDIATVLDVPLLRSGRVIGVVCHEQVGAPRSFRASDRLFAGSVGDLVALVLETARRIELERERAALRESVARMAQIESLGWLAAGVAHDFRNLLTVIAANAEYLTPALEGDKELSSARAITAAVESASALCDQLQAYAGKAPRREQPVAIGAALEGVSRDFQARLPPEVTFDVSLDPALPPARLDVAAVSRAVMNLLVNALEALPPEGGVITLSASECEPTPAAVAGGYDFRAAPSRCALIEVTDSGVGIAPALLARVPEPFYTTKARGSGFGLALVLGTVRAHQGLFHAESEEGRGSRFRLWFPLIDSPP